VVQNDCGHRVTTNDNPPSASQPYAQEGVSIDVPVDPTHPDKLSGTTGPQVPPGALGATTTISMGSDSRAEHPSRTLMVNTQRLGWLARFHMATRPMQCFIAIGDFFHHLVGHGCLWSGGDLAITQIDERR
jgi:hypothetical protein